MSEHGTASKVLEYRINLPMSVDEFQVAQLYMVMEASKENTGGGEGVEVLVNEPYDNSDGLYYKNKTKSGVEAPKNKGQYTLKKYHIANKIHPFIRACAPSDCMYLYEEAWNAYPHCRTVLWNKGMDPKKFFIDIETWHCPDKGTQSNACKLNKDELKKRKVIKVDIGGPLHPDYRDENSVKYTPSKFKSEKTGRGPLEKGWVDKSDPIMTAYKVVRYSFKYWGIQTKAESYIEGMESKLFTTTMRQSFCLIDDWFGLTMDDIRRMEAEVVADLQSKMKHDDLKAY